MTFHVQMSVTECPPSAMHSLTRSWKPGQVGYALCEKVWGRSYSKSLMTGKASPDPDIPSPSGYCLHLNTRSSFTLTATSLSSWSQATLYLVFVYLMIWTVSHSCLPISSVPTGRRVTVQPEAQRTNWLENRLARGVYISNNELSTFQTATITMHDLFC